jgi:hypothetical protein
MMYDMEKKRYCWWKRRGVFMGLTGRVVDLPEAVKGDASSSSTQ